MKRLLLLALLMGRTTNAHCDQKHGHQGTTTQGARQ
jgi:hypothetical protein